MRKLMTQYYSSGLYEQVFYIKHKINFQEDDTAFENIEYNSQLLAKHYKNELDFEYKHEDDKRRQIDRVFWDYLSYWPIYFEPLIFSEETALECGL